MNDQCTVCNIDRSNGDPFHLSHEPLVDGQAVIFFTFVFVVRAGLMINVDHRIIEEGAGDVNRFFMKQVLDTDAIDMKRLKFYTEHIIRQQF
jgi:hypothetical protein